MGAAHQKLKIYFLGRFRFLVGGKDMDLIPSRSGQLLTLLEYLVVNRRKNVTSEELYEVLWPDETGDPAGALKNLVYRLRTSFIQKGWDEGKKLLVRTAAGYAYNEEFPCETDIERFETLLRQAGETDADKEKKLQLYEEAFSLYTADFLSDQEAEMWTLPLNRYYHSLYFENVYPYMDLLMEKKDYAKLQKAATDAIGVDQFDERAHQYLLRALILQKRSAEAVNHYNYLQMLFYNELGVNLTEETQALYREVFKTVNRVEMDFDHIKQDVQESGNITGAYFCDYSVFKNMYRLEARLAERRKSQNCIALLTLDNDTGEQMPSRHISSVMEVLKGLLLDTLRKGDIVSQFSATQFVVLLQNVSETDAAPVLERIRKRFAENKNNRNFGLLTDLRSMDTNFE